MRIRVLGGGIYGCHLALALLKKGNDVQLWEIAPILFSGATGNIPARLHCGAHYPRSKLTRNACGHHFDAFMAAYGDFTRGVPCNVYAIAHDSLLDFGTYAQLMNGEIPCIPVYRPADIGLREVEGAILTGERHILVNRLRVHFEGELGNAFRYDAPLCDFDDDSWDATIDATFCANDAVNVDRYEVCLTVLLRGSVERAITIMDGPFPSLYPWDEERGLCSLTSAKWTPLFKCLSYSDAKAYESTMSGDYITEICFKMLDQMEGYYPAVRDFEIHDALTAIRAMPRSNADARLIDVRRIGNRSLRIRAGKLDAVFAAQQEIERHLEIFRMERAA